MTPEERARELLGKLIGVQVYSDTEELPEFKRLRERQVDDICKALEAERALALEQADKAIEQAMGDWEQGILEAVNSGDATMFDIRHELREHRRMEKYVRDKVNALAKGAK